MLGVVENFGTKSVYGLSVNMDGLVKIRLKDIYFRLRALSSLAPGSDVDLVLSELVDFVVEYREDFNWDAEYELADCFRLICSKAEAELEYFWLDKFFKDTSINLEKFPYYQNYVDLVKWEVDLLGEYLNKLPKKILFVGSGLPMSAIIMAKNFGVQIDCVDIDLGVVNKSKEIVKKLSLESVNFICADFYQIKDFSKYDLVVVAALLADQKLGFSPVFDHLNSFLTTGQTVLCRYGYGLTELFYKNISNQKFQGFKNVKKYHPAGRVINSILFLTKK
jgi:hypothetical protein